jgi:hypothetical protein
MNEVRFSFEHAYDVEQVDAPPENVRKIHFSGVTSHADAKPLSALISPKGREQWFGLFNRRRPEPTPEDGFYSLPDPRKLLVVSSLLGYVVNVASPDEWLSLGLQVFGLVEVPEASMILLWDATTVHAYGGRPLWTTKRLSYSGINIESTTATRATGSGWNAPDDTEARFEIDLATGESTGGAAPDQVGRSRIGPDSRFG